MPFVSGSKFSLVHQQLFGNQTFRASSVEGFWKTYSKPVSRVMNILFLLININININRFPIRQVIEQRKLLTWRIVLIYKFSKITFKTHSTRSNKGELVCSPFDCYVYSNQQNFTVRLKSGYSKWFVSVTIYTTDTLTFNNMA